MASGLLLSGLRSCLYLLEKDLAEPVRVLARLSPMVRRTTGKRMFVTLLLAVLDREEGTLTVASAGGPPLPALSFAAPPSWRTIEQYRDGKVYRTRLSGRGISFMVGGARYTGTVNGDTITGTGPGGAFTARRVATPAR